MVQTQGPVVVVQGRVRPQSVFLMVGLSCLMWGFTISGSDTRSCSSDTWTGQAPVCLPNGRSVLYNEGFKISGSDTRSCSSGTWTGQAPVCLPNGRSVLYNVGFTISGSDTKLYSSGVVEHGQVPGDRSCSTLSS